MTTFVTVLRRAVEDLENNTPEERADIYERARSALSAQLYDADPPLEPDELERQIADLDESISQVEAEYAAAQDEDAAAAIERQLGTGSHRQAAPSEHVPEEPAYSDLRSTLAETSTLGTATSHAAQSAREAYGAFDDGAAAGDDRPRDDQSYGEGVFGSDHQPAEHHFDAADEVAAAIGHDDHDRAHPDGHYGAPPPDAFEDDDDGGGRAVTIAMWAIVFLMIAGIAGAAYWQRDALTEVVTSFGEDEVEVAEVPEETKIEERVPTEVDPEPREDEAIPPEQLAEQPRPAEAALPAEAARVAQALLVEEGAGESLSSLGGTVDWALLDDPEAPAEAAKVIRATVQVPDKNMSLTMAIRRNTDPDLPASHTVELLFDIPADFESGGIAGVAGLVMKATPQSSGQPLIGAVVPVTDEFYLLGLSESEFDRARNIDELRRRDFIDIPIAYADESRAVLSIAKGESGTEVFQEAFAAWGH